MCRSCLSTASDGMDMKRDESEEDFKPLDIGLRKPVKAAAKRTKKLPVPRPRAETMKTNQDWTSVWPTLRTFHPATVPLPVRQGFTEYGASPGKFGNAELMKIPNFLHLTPPAIKKHCEALKKFCTPWPEGLETDEQINEHFPLRVIRSTYLHTSPSIRDFRSRKIVFQLKMSSLYLDYHSQDKLIRLLGDHYDHETDIITLQADRCPHSKQNYEYLSYLLTVLYKESYKVEEWEKDKSDADMEYFRWEGSASHSTVCKMVKNEQGNVNLPEFLRDVDIDKLADVTEIRKYQRAVENIHNEGEDDVTLHQYKESVKAILNMSENKIPLQGES